MIFHEDTGTLIVTPNKTGSTSLRYMLHQGLGFINITGPSIWDPNDIGSHCNADFLHTVHSIKIKRKILLFRNPTKRVLSLWKVMNFRKKRGGEIPFRNWINNCISQVGCSNMQVNYLSNRTGTINTDTMVQDVKRHFPGLDIGGRRENVTDYPEPEYLSPGDWEQVYVKFFQDFIFWRLLCERRNVRSDEFIRVTAPSDEAKAVLRDMEAIWYDDGSANAAFR